MSEVLLLTKILLKSSLKSQSNNKGLKSKVGKIIGYILIYGYVIGIISYLSYVMISALKTVNEEKVFINLALIGTISMICIRTLFSSMNVMFFSKDIEFLLPLPIKPYKIIMGKLNSLIMSEYMFLAVFLLPAVVVYGVMLNLGIGYYLIGILVFFIFPILPVLIITFIMSLIVKYVNILKNKDFVQYVSVFIFLILVFGMMFITSYGEKEITDEEIASIAVNINNGIAKYFFTIKPIMSMLENGNILNILKNFSILVLETFIPYLLFIACISKFYIKIATRTASMPSKHVDLNKKKQIKKQSTCISYVKKEFLCLVRNPIFLMQCVLPVLIFPIIFAIPIYYELINSYEISNFIYIAKYGIGTSLGVATCSAIISFYYMFNFTSVTAVSRDSEYANMVKYLPISKIRQCFYKMLPGIILNLAPMIYMDILLFCVCGIDIHVIISVIYIDIIAIIFNIFINYFAITIDLKNPKLNWTTEYAVVKQNINMIWQVFVCSANMAIVMILAIFIEITEVYAILLIVFNCIIYKLTKKHLEKNVTKLFNNIS